MKRIDLESLCKEARAKGLNINEIEVMKRHYYNAMIEYTTKHEPKPGVEAAIKHLEMQEWCGYAQAAGYMRRTIDEFQKEGDKK